MSERNIAPVRNKKFQDGGRPAAYLAFLPGLFKLCEELGYNLMPHGSLCRDFDLVAVAWAHGAVSAEELIQAIAAHTGGKIQDSLDCDAYDFTKRAAEPKPHGRYAWTIHLGGGPQLDISVMGPEPDSVRNSFDRMDESVARFEAAKTLLPYSKPSEKVKALADSLFQHIKHGDQAHQDWLAREALVWCAANFGDEPKKPSTADNSKCKFASGGAKCVHHCGDPACTQKKFAPSQDPLTQLQLATVIVLRDGKPEDGL